MNRYHTGKVLNYHYSKQLSKTCSEGLRRTERLGARFEPIYYAKIAGDLHPLLIPLKFMPFGWGKPQREWNSGGRWMVE